MKIFVKYKVIETKDIACIYEAGGRKHGFVIHFLDGSTLNICEDENYDSGYSEKRAINERYDRLKKEVIKYWEQDKTDMPIIC